MSMQNEKLTENSNCDGKDQNEVVESVKSFVWSSHGRVGKFKF